MKTKTQFNVFLENKPGRLANVCSALARDKVSILALTVMDSKEHSVLRFIVDGHESARTALRKQGFPFSETDVIVMELAHKPGAIAHVCEKLANEHVNIDYMYVSAGAKNGKTVAVLKATPSERVKQVLENNVASKAARAPIRRPPARKAAR